MERKKLLISLISLLISFSTSSNFVKLSDFCSKYNLKVRYNLEYDYFEIFDDKTSVRIFPVMPYIIHSNKIVFMKGTVMYNENGEILMPPDYISVVRGIFIDKQGVQNLISLSNSNFTLSSLSSKKSSSLSFSEISRSSVSSRESFRPIDCVIIDPGHGGKDPGGVGILGVKEKSIVMTLSKKLYDELKKETGITPFLTRKDDSYLTLKERINFVKKVLDKGYNPVFISIHANISLSPKIEGIEIYTLSEEATDKEAMSVELKENSNFELGDVKETEELYEILTDLIIDGLIRQSRELSSAIADSFSRQKELNLKAEKSANLFVLRYNLVPSVLIEIGYLSNLKEAKLLNQANYQDTIVKAMVKGIKNFVQYYNKTRGLVK